MMGAMQSARVPAEDAGIKVRVKQLWLGIRTYLESVTKKAKRSGGGEFTAST